MRIVPVLDIWHGVVVRGVAGQRERYRPLEPVCEPRAVAQSLIDRSQCRELYAADLGAITGGSRESRLPSWLADLGVARWIDAGLRDAADAQPWLDAGVEGIIAGLETLHGLSALQRLIAVCGCDRLLFSLDLRDGQALAAVEHWPTTEPMSLVERVLELGVRRVIVLDLARVGVGTGPGTETLCRAIAGRDSTIEVIVGGGIRDRADLERFEAAGASAALVASALHAGMLP